MDKFYEENKEFFVPRKHEVDKIKAGIMTYFPSVVLSIVLVAISGIGSLLQFNFSIKDVVWTTFFISLGLRLISNFLSKYVGSNLSYNKALYSDEVQKLKTDLLNEGQNIDRSAFEIYINDYNLESKKKAYRKRKKSKIQKINKKINRLAHKNQLEFSERRVRKIGILKNRVNELEAISTEEYIDKNIAYIKIKYKKVRSYYFLSPSEDYVEENVRYKVSFPKENTKEIILTLPITVILVFFSTLLAYDAVMGNVNAISVLYDVATMVFNFIIGWMVIGKHISSKMMNTFINRQNFIINFKASEKAKAGTNDIVEAQEEEVANA